MRRRLLTILWGRKGLFVTLTVALLTSACSKPTPIKIGFVAGVSGRVADLGIAGRNAVILAVDQKNAAGGIGGRPIELLIRDDEQNPETAKRVVQELIEAKVEAIVGNMTSSMSAVTIPLANSARIPMVSPTSTSLEFSGKDDHFFRIVSSTDTYSTRSALLHRNQLKASRVAVAYDLRNRTYCESWLSGYRRVFVEAGGKIVSITPFESSADTSMHDLAQQLLKERPDSVLLIANAADAALISQQIRRETKKVLITAAEWAATEQLIQLGGKAVEGMYLAQFIDRGSEAPAYLAFRDAFVKRFGQEPGFGGIAAYDAATAVLTALETRKPGQGLKEALLAAPSYAGLQETFKFDENGETNRRNHITTIRNGQFLQIKE